MQDTKDPMPDDIDADEFTYIEAGCHCELNSFAIPLRSSNLPIPVDFCHCNICRHTSGELAVQYVPFEGVPIKSSRPVSRTRIVKQLHGNSRSRSRSPTPGSHKHDHLITTSIANLLAPPIVIKVEDPPPSPFELSNLNQYEASDGLTHCFCKTCSAQLFQVQKVDGKAIWSVAVGVLDRTEGIVKIRAHIWVGDTLDGGFANHFRMLDNVELPRYKEGFGSELLSPTWRDPVLDGHSKGSQDNLPVYCHCRTVSFNITRPNEDSTLPSAPFPDVLCPYNVTHLYKIRNPSDQKWWLRANNTRYLAGYCMCPTCRLTSGMELQTWAFVPIWNILDPRTNEPISLRETDKRPPGLKQYMSTPGRYRECCETCGAVVFWWQSNRQELIDISVGLFDEKAGGGARAEDWLEWHKDRISFSDSAMSPALVKGLLEGLNGGNIGFEKA